ncbi:hypothetical protein [Bifidobacterium pullorum]|uniref:Uncharacterized protein n=1 Tax=Bifidobacterium pullorum subsp. gallinarum TaxID=78344 RepID=A0A921IZ74_9BIFI|nr:hypothetical protein [Bifidobacterium pullorum]HJG41847.1 hypothetical protein [Bifidobacterium pullorum subsp. gallinarum]
MKVFSVLVPSGFFGDESGDMAEATSLQIEGNRPYAYCTKDARGGMRTDATEVVRPFPEVGRRSFGYAKERAVMRLVYKLVMFLCGSLCSLIMLVVGEPEIAALLAVCVLLVVLDVPERIGRLVNRGAND